MIEPRSNAWASPHESEIEKLLGTKIYLDRGVKVAKDWPRDPK
jgi:GTPase Era involved in 16S rRNA processing